jgi:hypothetical protein
MTSYFTGRRDHLSGFKFADMACCFAVVNQATLTSFTLHRVSWKMNLTLLFLKCSVVDGQLPDRRPKFTRSLVSSSGLRGLAQRFLLENG